MFARFFEQLKPACGLFLWLSLLTGLVYPALVTVLGTGLWPQQARGSLSKQGEVVIGSALIGQPFAAPGYFTGRPSATSPEPYNAAASAGSNLAASNPALRELVEARAAALTDAQPPRPVPMDLATASSSGLDPHLSPAAAAWQIARVAKARGLPAQAVADLVARHTEERLWGFWGERRINVLGLNLALDAAGSRQ